MFTPLICLFTTLDKNVVHYDLGKSDGLTLSVDFEIQTDPTDSAAGKKYEASFSARNDKAELINEKVVELGLCSEKPNSLLVEDRFHQGYKQVFISLKYGGIKSYLFAFKNRQFYTAYMNDAARVYADALASKKGVWLIRESDSLVHQTLDSEASNSTVKNGMVYTHWKITPNSKPVINN